jgi:hypothetical protein
MVISNREFYLVGSLDSLALLITGLIRSATTIHNLALIPFRHFLTEQFHDASEWFERRLAYTRSVACSSIVGFVLGLGDRHPYNILIDMGTAELVHIDLGLAFDQVGLLSRFVI